MMKAISKLGDKVNAYATKMEETDQWFEDKTFVIDNLDQQLRKLLTATEAMVDYRWEEESNVSGGYCVFWALTLKKFTRPESKY